MFPDCSSIMRAHRSRTNLLFLSRSSPICLWYQARGYKHHRHKKAESRTNLYTVLGVTPKATQTQIKMAYYKLSKVYHPDLNQGSKTAQDHFAAISEAYSILGNVSLRRRYDRGIFSHQDLHSESREKVAQTEKKDRARNFSVYYNTHGQRMYDFDEFYKAHYGEALHREQRERELRKRRSQQWKEEQEKAKTPFLMTLGIFGGFIVLTSWFLRRL